MRRRKITPEEWAAMIATTQAYNAECARLAAKLNKPIRARKEAAKRARRIAPRET